jgi:nuclear pore complex protein Nup155
MLEKYAFEYQRDVGPPTWVMDMFIDVGVPFETLLRILESMFYNDEAPFQGPRNRRVIAHDMIYVIQCWYEDGIKNNSKVFGSEVNQSSMIEILSVLMQNDVGDEKANECRMLRVRIEQLLRQ